MKFIDLLLRSVMIAVGEVSQHILLVSLLSWAIQTIDAMNSARLACLMFAAKRQEKRTPTWRLDRTPVFSSS
jgi:hypothetical protein